MGSSLRLSRLNSLLIQSQTTHPLSPHAVLFPSGTHRIQHTKVEQLTAMA